MKVFLSIGENNFVFDIENEDDFKIMEAIVKNEKKKWLKSKKEATP